MMSESREIESASPPRDVAEAYGMLAGAIRDAGVPVSAIAGQLDDLAPGLRVAVVRRLGRAEQRRLYERVAGFAPLGLTDLVPADRRALEPVRHYGLNTLPAFRVFEKRFCRGPGEDPSSPSELAGYNHQAMQRITGPGYFVAVEDARTREVLVDYTRLPKDRPEDWPAIRSNERGLARFVYGFMIDRLRRVSQHVTVGSAARRGRELGSYFVLSREVD